MVLNERRTWCQLNCPVTTSPEVRNASASVYVRDPFREEGWDGYPLEKNNPTGAYYYSTTWNRWVPIEKSLLNALVITAGIWIILAGLSCGVAWVMAGGGSVRIVRPPKRLVLR